MVFSVPWPACVPLRLHLQEAASSPSEHKTNRLLFSPQLLCEAPGKELRREPRRFACSLVLQDRPGSLCRDGDRLRQEKKPRVFTARPPPPCSMACCGCKEKLEAACGPEIEREIW